MKELLVSNLSVKNGVLHVGKHSALELVAKYGTPLYVMDEEVIRKNCRAYASALKKYCGENSLALYASKACCFKRIYEIIAEEGLGADVVSVGEIFTAQKAGFPLEKMYFQGNNKTDYDIEYAIKAGVGYFVCDNVEEVDAIEKIAESLGAVQKILLRLTPGIDPHTYDEVATGKVDSKFGTAIETGQAEVITAHTLSLPHVSLCGFHCHVGSMVFESSTFTRSAEIMLKFIADVKKKYGFEAKILDLGGGYGVRYTPEDPELDIEKNIALVANYITCKCEELGISKPSLRLEPGRSIVADAGVTLYTAGTVKKITGYKNYVSIDGGMTDNPRYALYGSVYTVLSAAKMNEACNFKCDLVGRCCESGDIIQPEIMLPESTCRGDIIAVLTTGAYNYSMASNYNRVARPAVVMVNGDDSYLAVKRETLEDLTALDI